MAKKRLRAYTKLDTNLRRVPRMVCFQTLDSTALERSDGAPIKAAGDVL
jgi:hypothetical protein